MVEKQILEAIEKKDQTGLRDTISELLSENQTAEDLFKEIIEKDNDFLRKVSNRLEKAYANSLLTSFVGKVLYLASLGVEIQQDVKDLVNDNKVHLLISTQQLLEEQGLVETAKPQKKQDSSPEEDVDASEPSGEGFVLIESVEERSFLQRILDLLRDFISGVKNINFSSDSSKKSSDEIKRDNSLPAEINPDDPFQNQGQDQEQTQDKSNSPR